MFTMMKDYLFACFAPYMNNEEGQGMVEYALIIALIAILLIAVLVAMRGGLTNIFTEISNVLNNPGAAQ